MLAGLLAVCLATIVSVWLQFHVAVHTRPILDPALHLETVVPPWTWDRMSSFPSDTATLFFGLAAVVFVEQRLVGLFCFVWVAVIIAIPRVIFGFHYASDIIGSLVPGSACVFIFAGSPYPRRLFDRTLMLFEGRMYIVSRTFFRVFGGSVQLVPELGSSRKRACEIASLLARRRRQDRRFQ
jgi:membrane-associated phospholipid phosphatase